MNCHWERKTQDCWYYRQIRYLELLFGIGFTKAAKPIHPHVIWHKVSVYLQEIIVHHPKFFSYFSCMPSKLSQSKLVSLMAISPVLKQHHWKFANKVPCWKMLMLRWRNYPHNIKNPYSIMTRHCITLRFKTLIIHHHHHMLYIKELYEK